MLTCYVLSIYGGKKFLRMGYKKLEEAVRDRIKQVQKEKKITENRLAAGDSATQSRLNRQLSHGSSITLDTILRLLTTCPDVSADWLLRGQGEMITTVNNVTGAGRVTGKNATVIGQQAGVLTEAFVRDLLAEKDKQIAQLLSIISR